MTTFKPGDKVTSPALFGEWYVWGDDGHAASLTVFGVQCVVVVQSPSSGQKQMCLVPIDTLTLVAPPLPPEPPVGSVVFVDGEGFVNRGGVTPWYSLHRAGAQWADIAATARPAVPQPTVDEMADALKSEEREGFMSYLADAEFLIARLWPEEGDQ